MPWVYPTGRVSFYKRSSMVTIAEKSIFAACLYILYILHIYVLFQGLHGRIRTISNIGVRWFDCWNSFGFIFNSLVFHLILLVLLQVW